MDLYCELGKLVKKARQERGFTQQRLADEVGLNRVSIANIEAGNHHPPFHYVVRLADVLLFDISEFMNAHRERMLEVQMQKRSKEVGIDLKSILKSKGKSIEATT